MVQQVNRIHIGTYTHLQAMENPYKSNVKGMRKLGTAWMQNELLGLVSGELREEGGQMALIEGTNTSLFIKNGTQSMQWLVMQGESPFSPPKVVNRVIYHAIACSTQFPAPPVLHTTPCPLDRESVSTSHIVPAYYD